MNTRQLTNALDDRFGENGWDLARRFGGSWVVHVHPRAALPASTYGPYPTIDAALTAALDQTT